MNSKRMLGQVLLWAGFISAALAATSHREFDFLDEGERTSLNKIPHVAPDNKFMLNEDELKSVSMTSLSDMTADELDSVIDKVVLISEKNVAAAAAAEAEAKRKMEAESPPEPEKEMETDPDAKKVKDIKYATFEKARTTLLKNKWPVVPWLWYGLSMAVGLVGVALLRSTSKLAEQEKGRVAEELETIKTSLAKLNQNVLTLGKEIASKSPTGIVSYIDQECAPAFSDFAEARNALIQQFGMQPYAEIMTQFASAERFVNRTWSAAADGYLGEADESASRASAHLQEAAKLLDKYENQQTSKS